MSDLHAQFEAAVAASRQLSQKPDNDTLLEIYALYKQATAGDVSGKRPGFTNFVGRAKYDAWAKLKGRSADDAKQAYVTLINRLQAKDGQGFG